MEKKESAMDKIQYMTVKALCAVLRVSEKRWRRRKDQDVEYWEIWDTFSMHWVTIAEVAE